MASAPQPDPVAGLIDMPLPMPVSLWPQTWPLRVALTVTVVGLVLGIWRLGRWWWRNRYRRAALAEFPKVQPEIHRVLVQTER